MNNTYNELKKEIEKAEEIIIFSHVNPDGDTLGSNLALAQTIRKYFNKKVESVFVGCLPDMYKYLPGFLSFKDISEIYKNKIYDMAIAVDVASKDRLVVATPIFDIAKIRVNIDHHKTNNGYADINIIDGKAACVGIILYNIFKEWGIEILEDTARCLYTSLMTDTGGFRYENTTPEVFNLAAELVKLGVSPTREFRECYESKPQNMIQFQAHIVSNTSFIDNGKIAFTKVYQSDMEKYNATADFTEGIVEIIRSSKDVEVAGILKETKDGYTKVSLRSKTIDLAPIVAKFDGGGHTFAAGCTIKKPIDIAYNKLLECVQSELE